MSRMFSEEFRNVGGSRTVFPKLRGGLSEDIRADDSWSPTVGPCSRAVSGQKRFG